MGKSYKKNSGNEYDDVDGAKKDKKKINRTDRKHEKGVLKKIVDDEDVEFQD